MHTMHVMHLSTSISPWQQIGMMFKWTHKHNLEREREREREKEKERERAYRRWVCHVTESQTVDKSVYSSSAATAHKQNCILL